MKLGLYFAFSIVFAFVNATPPPTPVPQTMNPKDILFSLATINDALPAIDPKGIKSDKDLILHEDDWRQFELISMDWDSTVASEILEIQKIFKDKSRQVGEFKAFTGIYIRKMILVPFPKPLSMSELLIACGIDEKSLHQVRIDASPALVPSPGIVKGGFSLQLANLTIYGIRDLDAVGFLCFVPTSYPGLDPKAGANLAEYLVRHKLLLVHWPSASIIRIKEDILAYLTKTDPKPTGK